MVDSRQSLATNLRDAGVDLKTAQELLRHANSRITHDAYTRAISTRKREANNRVMTKVLEAGKKNALPAPSQGAKEEKKKVRIAPAFVDQHLSTRAGINMRERHEADASV